VVTADSGEVGTQGEDMKIKQSIVAAALIASAAVSSFTSAAVASADRRNK
jgi:hypothetical protein